MAQSSCSSQIGALSGSAASRRLPRPFTSSSTQCRAPLAKQLRAVHCRSEGAAGRTCIAVSNDSKSCTRKMHRESLMICMVVTASASGGSGHAASGNEGAEISRRRALSHMAVLSLVATQIPCSKAYAAEGAPQELQGDVRAAVMQAFKQAADKGKVWRPSTVC